MSNNLEWLKVIDEVGRELDKANRKEEIILLYRGEGRPMFGSKTGTELNIAADPHYDSFFVIGSKAKSYLLHKNEKFTELKQFDSDTKVKYIFECLNRLSKKEELKKMLIYFNNSGRITNFRSRMFGITNADDRLTIENFFLAFIHTWSSAPETINAYSVLISSTRDVEVAKTFSNGGFIIAFWLSNPIPNQAIDYHKIEEYGDLLSRCGLPNIDSIHFPDESEVTIFSAIFPHNIFYVYDLSKNRIIFNPYILESDLNNVVTQSINVDQSHFDEKMKGIYARSIWRSDRRLLYEKDAPDGSEPL